MGVRRRGPRTPAAVVGPRRDVQQEEAPPTGRGGQVAAIRVAGRTAVGRCWFGRCSFVGRCWFVGRCSALNQSPFVGGCSAFDNPAFDSELHASVGHPDRRGTRDHRRLDHHLDRRDTGHPGWLGHGRGRWSRKRRSPPAASWPSSSNHHAVGAEPALLIPCAASGALSAGDREVLVVNRSVPCPTPGPTVSGKGGDDLVARFDDAGRKGCRST